MKLSGPDRNLDHFLRIGVEVPEAQLTSTVRIDVPPFEDGNYGSPPGPQEREIILMPPSLSYPSPAWDTLLGLKMGPTRASQSNHEKPGNQPRPSHVTSS